MNETIVFVVNDILGHAGDCRPRRGHRPADDRRRDIGLYGASSDLRGCETGRFRDTASWATQAEIRHRFSGRFGVVAFAGVGGIAPSFGNLGDGKVLHAVGAGLRWQVSKETPIKLRIDYAIGKDFDGLYISVGEAF